MRCRNLQKTTEKNLKRTECHSRTIWVEFKRDNIRIINVFEEQEGESDEEPITEEIRVKNFPELRSRGTDN